MPINPWKMSTCRNALKIIEPYWTVPGRHALPQKTLQYVVDWLQMLRKYYPITWWMKCRNGFFGYLSHVRPMEKPTTALHTHITLNNLNEISSRNLSEKFDIVCTHWLAHTLGKCMQASVRYRLLKYVYRPIINCTYLSSTLSHWGTVTSVIVCPDSYSRYWLIDIMLSRGMPDNDDHGKPRR